MRLGSKQQLLLGMVLRFGLSGCAAAPVGAIDGRVPSRFTGEALAVVRAAAAQPGQRGATGGVDSYIVQQGDTLWSLARRFGTSVDRLMSANGLARPQDLHAGKRLSMPSKGSMQKQPTHVAAKKGTREPSSLGSKTGGSRGKYALTWPVDGTITSRFGKRSGRHHDGIDIGASKGTQVRAAAAGEVLFAAKQGGYGNLVLLKHADGIVTVYAHHERNLVRKGQHVEAGQVIAFVGQTGRSTGPHLHFEVRRGVKPDNPLRYLPP